MPPPPPPASRLGPAVEPLCRYAEILADEGVTRGVIGPREVPRLWQRHLLNCAALVPALPMRGAVADVGSGAGLPGIVLALCRPTLTVTLVEPLARRVDFLREAVAALGLSSVEIVRARAEDLAGTRQFDVVTARALAPLPRLAAWCLPLVRSGGILLALKGAGAAEEVAQAGPQLLRMGAGRVDVLALGAEFDAPTQAVRVELVGNEGPAERRTAGRRRATAASRSRSSDRHGASRRRARARRSTGPAEGTA